MNTKKNVGLVLVFLYLIFSIGTTVYAVNNSSKFPILYPMSQSGKWGFIDNSGKVVIKPQYDQVKQFSEGLAWVSVNSKTDFQTRWYLIDSTGRKILSDLLLVGASNFKNGLCSIITRSNDFGKNNRVFIDKAGKVIAKYDNTKCGMFSEGLLAMTTSTDESGSYLYSRGNWGYLNSSNAKVITPSYLYASDFSEGLACIETEGGMGYIDKKGTIVIKPQFDYAGDFHEGYAVVGEGSNNNIGFVESGLLESDYYFSTNIMRREELLGQTMIEPFDLVTISKYGAKLGFIDKSGNNVIKPQFDSVKYFSNGLACVKKDKWGYLNSTGKMITDFKYDNARSFSEGLAAINAPDDFGINKWGFIDKTGEITIPLKYEDVRDFHEGLAAFNDKGLWGFIDTKGNVVIKPLYSKVDDFSSGIAYVMMYRNYKYDTCYINKTGKKVWTSY